MKFCSYCGKQIMDEAVICPNCGCATNNVEGGSVIPGRDEISVGLVILAVLIPLFGIIYWPVKHREAPRRARACGAAALISWGVSFFLGMLMIMSGAMYW